VARRATERDTEENLVADFHGFAANVVRVFDRAIKPPPS